MIGDMVSSNLMASARTDTTPGEASPMREAINPVLLRIVVGAASGRRRLDEAEVSVGLTKANDGGTTPKSLFIDFCDKGGEE